MDSTNQRGLRWLITRSRRSSRRLLRGHRKTLFSFIAARIFIQLRNGTAGW